MNKHTFGTVVFLSALLFLAIFFPKIQNVYAHEYQDKKTGYDIIFVLDVSGSMKETDKNRNSIEVIKMMIDMCTIGNTRIGFVAYNDNINSCFSLADVSNTSLRNDLKKAIDKSAFSGYSDMGLGLKRALNLTGKSKDIGNQPIIILLSDGETDLSGSNTGRTNKDSENDIQDCINKAQKKNIPIYTIGLTDNFDTNLDYLKDISDQTKGISYTATSPYQLVNIFNGILSENISSVLTPVESETATGKSQYFDIDVSDKSLSELNIMLFSDNSLEVTKVLTSSKNVSVIPSNSYQLIKILNPVMETIRITAKDIKGATIRLSTLGVYSFADVICTPDSITKLKNTTFNFHFYDTVKETNVSDEKLYQNLSFNFYIKDLETGVETKYPATAAANGFHMDSTFAKPGKYEIRAEYSGEAFFGQTNSYAFEVVNTPPVKKKALEDTIAKQNGTKTYDISVLFKDPDKDVLSYTFLSKKGADVKALINQNQLILTPLSYGDTTLSIQATDTDGAKCTSTVTIHSIPIWKYYHRITTILLMFFFILLALIASIFIIRYLKKRATMPKLVFIGCLIGYFISTKNQIEIPPLKWTLSEYPNKAISLSRLLKARSIDIPLPDADKIWFSPKAGNCIELIHSTRCTILIGTQAIQRNTPAIIHMGEKIFIAFEDLENELELRYKNS
jgi:Mg-chelatase subunit ChlD